MGSAIEPTLVAEMWLSTPWPPFVRLERCEILLFMPAKAASRRTKATKSAMSAQHKQALAVGREESRAVRRYLEALEAHRPRRGRKRPAESIEARLRLIDNKLPNADPLTKVHLVPERINLENELASKGEEVDMKALEDAFVE